MAVDGVAPPKGERGHAIQFATADSGYFDAAGIELLRGRVFTTADNQGMPRVAVVNEAFARKFWPTGDALNRTFRIDTAVYRIVGIIETTKIRSLSESGEPFFFEPFIFIAEKLCAL
jgi:hypothetical protein